MRRPFFPLAFVVLLTAAVAHAAPADLLPPVGPHGSVAVPFAPGVPGASEAAAHTYVRADGRRFGALLAAVPGPGYDAGAALVAFAGTPRSRRPVLLDGHPFTLVTVTTAEGGTAYAVAFTATPARRGFVVAADAAPGAGDTHVVATAESADGATALAAAALAHLAATAPPLAFAETLTPALAAPAAAPNPFAGATTLRFALPAAADATVTVYDALGRRVAVLAEGAHAAGEHAVPFAAHGLAPGVYFVRLTTGASTATGRLTIR